MLLLASDFRLHGVRAISGVTFDNLTMSQGLVIGFRVLGLRLDTMVPWCPKACTPGWIQGLGPEYDLAPWFLGACPELVTQSPAFWVGPLNPLLVALCSGPNP